MGKVLRIFNLFGQLVILQGPGGVVETSSALCTGHGKVNDDDGCDI